MIREGMRAMVFSAHAADFCSRAGGTIARIVDAGGTVQVIDMTYGIRCESQALWTKEPRPTYEEVRAIRKQELHDAAATLGAQISCFGFEDSPLVLGPDRRLQILDAIREFRPDLVLSHWIQDIMHPDHVETTQAVLWACSYSGSAGIETAHPPFGRAPLVCYETTLGTSPIAKFLPNLYVDITPVFERKIEALKKLAGGQPPLPEAYTILARYRALEARHCGGLGAECEFAEAFGRLGTEAVGV
jgi:4-oxalomesaconate hydratase